MSNKNAEALKAYSKKAGVPLWAVAEKVGVSEFTFSRWMRHLSVEDKDRYCRLIDTLRECEENE